MYIKKTETSKSGDTLRHDTEKACKIASLDSYAKIIFFLCVKRFLSA